MLLSVLAWLLLLAIKICNGIVLLGKACAHVMAYKELKVFMLLHRYFYKC